MIFWCTADIGWITGHSAYFMALLNGTVIFEGVPSYPDYSRFGKLKSTKLPFIQPRSELWQKKA
jgi:acyl-coenzyme A synthetase/AMP-(fatty) acid ligase